MSQTERTVISRTPIWAHSWHCKHEHANAVGVKEKVIVEYSDGTTEYEDNLKIYKDPQRPFWVTKPQFRNHEYKKEFEDLEKCEQFICRDSELEERLEMALGYSPMSFRRRNLRQLCSSPFVYGADIDTQTLIKQKYANDAPVGKVAVFSRGGLDIESEIRGQKRINLMTFIHENTIYTAALKEYCKIEQEDKTFREATEEDCLKVVNEMLGPYFKKHKFTLVFKILDTELDVIKWIFQQIHKHKTDYIGIWNLGFDIPKIIERIVALGADPAEVMCHPEVPRQYRFVDWYEDKSDVQHFTDKWHWANIAGYSQFIDSMCLYARLRKVSGRDSSYALDEISNKELGQGKLHFGAITNHWFMQNFRFLEYIAYNINDVMIMQLMEWQNNDMSALSGLTGMSLLSQFSRQTVMVRNDAYNYAKARGKVPASAGVSMFTEYDKMQLKAGGTVLPPNKAVGVGVSVLLEIDRPTQVSLLTNDLDVSSMYPSITSAFNISKETALGTVICINGHSQYETETFFSGVNQPDVNAVPLAQQFFGLYGYKEMADRYRKHLRTATAPDGQKLELAA